LKKTAGGHSRQQIAKRKRMMAVINNVLGFLLGVYRYVIFARAYNVPEKTIFIKLWVF
jgi:hypothetical protein